MQRDCFAKGISNTQNDNRGCGTFFLYRKCFFSIIKTFNLKRCFSTFYMNKYTKRSQMKTREQQGIKIV